MDNIINIDTSSTEIKQAGNDLYSNREISAGYNTRQFNSDVTIWIQAYNNIDKTKRCVESVIKYSEGIDYDLLLVDNGSTDETFEYFKSLDIEKKTIIRISDNRGGPLPGSFIGMDMLANYLVILACDVVVTKNWLSNLINIAKSDPKIGMICAKSSNTSNFQNPGLTFSDYDDMQKKAAAFNISDPRKWEERLRLITLATFYTKACLCAIGLPVSDVGFAHNFGDDDVTFKVRRLGYKAILAGDTWVHHDDDKSKLSPEKARKLNEDLAVGRQNFRNKYFGIDAWDDVNNFIPEYVSVLKPADGSGKDKVLGIDVKCGTPILEIKNNLRKRDVFDTECFAFTTDAKYMIDLQTVCGAENVYSGGIDSFGNNFNAEAFGHIVIGNDINTYADPFRVVKTAYGLLKKGGQLFVSLQNTMNIFGLMNMIGKTNVYNTNHALNYTIEEFLSGLTQRGYKAKYLSNRIFDSIAQDHVNFARDCMRKLAAKDVDEAVFRLVSERYFLLIEK